MEGVLNKEIISNKTLCRAMGAILFVILTGLGAFVRIPLPFTPIPITLQTFFVLLSGAFLGGRLGAVSQLGYLFFGLSGLPIFAGAGSGWLYLLGPTGGYIFGFVLASLFIGRTIKSARSNPFFVFAVFSLADFIILACGVTWLKFLFGYSFVKLLFIGIMPFIVGDLLKVLLASAIFLKLKTRLGEIF